MIIGGFNLSDKANQTVNSDNINGKTRNFDMSYEMFLWMVIENVKWTPKQMDTSYTESTTNYSMFLT